MSLPIGPPLRVLKRELVDRYAAALRLHAPAADKSSRFVAMYPLVAGFRLNAGGDAFLECEGVCQREHFDHLVRKVQGVLLLRFHFPFHSLFQFLSFPFLPGMLRERSGIFRRFPEVRDLARLGVTKPLMFLELSDSPVFAAISTDAHFYVADSSKLPEKYRNRLGKFPQRASVRLDELRIGVEVAFIVRIGQQERS